jgi:hypothetical protein
VSITAVAHGGVDTVERSSLDATPRGAGRRMAVVAVTPGDRPHTVERVPRQAMPRPREAGS